MQVYHLEAIISSDGTLTVKGLPFREGDRVEVTVRSRERKPGERYPLRGKLVRYVEPFGSVAEDDWNALR